LEEFIVDSLNYHFKSVDGILFNKRTKTLIRYPCAKNGNTFTVPDNITGIESYAFEGCVQLKTVTIPSSVTSIEDHIFEGSNPCHSNSSLGGNVLHSVCVLIDYSLSSFCGRGVYSVSHSFDHLRGQHNHCFEVLVCGKEEDYVIIRKRENATLWENQTSGGAGKSNV